MAFILEAEDIDRLEPIIKQHRLLKETFCFTLYFKSNIQDIEKLSEIANIVCSYVTEKINESNEFKLAGSGWRKQKFRLLAEPTDGFSKSKATFIASYEDDGAPFPVDLAYRAAYLVLQSKKFKIG